MGAPMSSPLAPETSPAPESDLSALTGRLRAGFEAGRRKYGALELPFATYAGDVINAVRARRRSMGLPVEPSDLDAALSKRALDDLYLARACEHGCEQAWAVLATTFRSRLIGLAVRRGARGDQSESLGDELFSQLALPPAKSAGRTRIGSFDGSGSLWGWLAASLARRLHDAHRRARPARSLEEAAPAPARPLVAALDEETAESVQAALRSAWTLLEPRERVALLLKHEHGWRQRQIAQRLGVGEHQVSRWCSRAVSKLRGALQGAALTEAGWEALRHEMRRHLARSAALERLPVHPAAGNEP